MRELLRELQRFVVCDGLVGGFVDTERSLRGM